MNHEFNNVKNGQNDPLVDALQNIGRWFTFRNVMRRFPLLYPLSYLFLPPRVALSYLKGMRATSKVIHGRVETRSDPNKPLDYLAQFLKDEKGKGLPPHDFLHAQAGHLILDHYESSSVLTAGVYFLMRNPDAMAKLQAELRQTFRRYGDISEDRLQDLAWLNATIEEIIRLHTNVPYGLPRISPGYTVDGHYVPEGVTVATCAYATHHSTRYFLRPYEFRPERWLPASHAQYDRQFDSDERSAFRPFSMGPRNCLGQAMAYVVLRIMLAKLCWSFDWRLLNEDEVDWDRDLRLYMYWKKPRVQVRLAPCDAAA